MMDLTKSRCRSLKSRLHHRWVAAFEPNPASGTCTFGCYDAVVVVISASVSLAVASQHSSTITTRTTQAPAQWCSSPQHA